MIFSRQDGWGLDLKEDRRMTVYLFFFSFSEEKKKQKEELSLNSWVFRPLRRSMRGAAPSIPANF